MRCTGRRVRAVAVRRIALRVTAGARQTHRTLAVRTTHHIHPMAQPGIELQGCIAGDMAVLAARALKHFLHRGKGVQRRLVFSK
ncbi:hypothetical protein D3C87_1901290 [compost metagenome]